MICRLTGVQKSFDEIDIILDASFMLQSLEKAALVGINGAGKTSIFKMITGEWDIDEGHIEVPKKIGYLPQNIDAYYAQTLREVLTDVFLPLHAMEAEMRRLEADLTDKQAAARYDALSHAFLAEGGYEIESRVTGVLRGLGFEEADWGRNFDSLSGGEKTRALLGRTLLMSTDLLLLDEPTNHLDVASITWLEEYLRSLKCAVLLISHDRFFIDNIVTKTIEIENKITAVYNGNYSYFAAEKERNREVLAAQHAKQQKTIAHHENVVETLLSYRTEIAIKRAKSRQKMIDKIERVIPPPPPPPPIRLSLTPRLKSGNDVFFAEGLTMGYDAPLYEDVTFDLRRGQRAALLGPNGAGKTTLLKNIVGEIAPQAGKIRMGVNVVVGYYNQASSFASEAKTVFQDIADTYPTLTNTQIRNTLAALMFKGEDVFKPIWALSGGEKGRVQLAKILLLGANFLILDEPTNHLDMFSKEVLESALCGFGGTVLYVSHDRYFIKKTATKILDLSKSGFIVYNGGYDYYLEKLPNAVATAEAVQKNITDYHTQKQAQSDARRQKSALDRLEAAIAQREADIKRLDAVLESPEVATDHVRAAEVYGERAVLVAELDGMLEEWGRATLL